MALIYRPVGNSMIQSWNQGSWLILSAPFARSCEHLIGGYLLCIFMHGDFITNRNPQIKISASPRNSGSRGSTKSLSKLPPLLI
jgi:hypothetical protein